MPGREPTDRDALRRLSMGDYLEAVLAQRQQMGAAPIVIGHSMGGLLAQQVAAATPCAALVCLSSVPPGVRWAQPRAAPHLARLLPRILAGRVVLPTAATLRAIVFNDLDESETTVLAREIVSTPAARFGH